MFHFAFLGFLSLFIAWIHFVLLIASWFLLLIRFCVQLGHVMSVSPGNMCNRITNIRCSILFKTRYWCSWNLHCRHLGVDSVLHNVVGTANCSTGAHRNCRNGEWKWDFWGTGKLLSCEYILKISTIRNHLFNVGFLEILYCNFQHTYCTCTISKT